MTPKPFDDQVREAFDRVAALRSRADKSCGDEVREVLREGLEELAVALEELNVAQEELQAQNEALEESKLVLVAERDRYRDLFEFAPVAYVVTDSEGVIRQANRVAGELLQVVPRYLRGKPLAVFVAAVDRLTLLTGLTAAQRGEPISTRFLRLLPRPEGSESRTTMVDVVPFKDTEFGGMYLRWQFIDTTERSRLERSLRAKESAEDDLASAARRKDEFMAVLGHELRGPLGAVRNAAELIRANLPADSNVLPSVAVIERQARRMTRLMDDLLDVARIAQGKMQFHPTTINLVDVVRAAVEGVRPVAGALDLSAVLPSGPVLVRADPDRLDQILSNLLTNAVKYTKTGSVSVAVEATDSEAVVRVIDTGVGISEEMLPHIFNLFVQATDSRDRAEGGLGIGLHLVRRLVELHGGLIEAFSEGHEKGSEFVVRLPVDAAK